MKTKFALALAAGLFTIAPAFAGSVQSIPISFSTSGSSYSFGVIASDFVASGIQPFDSTTGTLNSFEFLWNLSFSASGETDGSASDSNPEDLSGSANGAYFIGSSIYAGAGNGGGDGSSEPNQPLSFTFQVIQDTTFQVADAGVTYNPYILDSVTGSSPFASDYAATYSLYDFAGPQWSAQVTGSLTVTYNSTPEPSTFALMPGAVLLAGVFLYRRRIA